MTPTTILWPAPRAAADQSPAIGGLRAPQLFSGQPAQLGSRCPFQTEIGLPLNQLTVVYCTHVRFIMNNLRTRCQSNLGNAICEPESALPQKRTLLANDLQQITRDRPLKIIYDCQSYINCSPNPHKPARP